MVFELWNDLPKKLHKVLLHNANDMEAIGNDSSIREVFSDQASVGGTQVHADDSDLVSAFERFEVVLQFSRAAAFDNIEDSLGLQVA